MQAQRRRTRTCRHPANSEYCFAAGSSRRRQAKPLNTRGFFILLHSRVPRNFRYSRSGIVEAHALQGIQSIQYTVEVRQALAEICRPFVKMVHIVV